MIPYESRNTLLLFSLVAALFFSSAIAFSADEWLPDFEDICSKTEDSGAMSKDELKALIDRCDRLKPIIEKSDNPQKNVYIFRLDKCKKLFLYVLEVSGN